MNFWRHSHTCMCTHACAHMLSSSHACIHASLLTYPFIYVRTRVYLWIKLSSSFWLIYSLHLLTYIPCYNTEPFIVSEMYISMRASTLIKPHHVLVSNLVIWISDTDPISILMYTYACMHIHMYTYRFIQTIATYT